jgi:hypothetical protein
MTNGSAQLHNSIPAQNLHGILCCIGIGMTVKAGKNSRFLLCKTGDGISSLVLL